MHVEQVATKHNHHFLNDLTGHEMSSDPTLFYTRSTWVRGVISANKLEINMNFYMYKNDHIWPSPGFYCKRTQICCLNIIDGDHVRRREKNDIMKFIYSLLGFK